MKSSLVVVAIAMLLTGCAGWAPDAPGGGCGGGSYYSNPYGAPLASERCYAPCYSGYSHCR